MAALRARQHEIDDPPGLVDHLDRVIDHKVRVQFFTMSLQNGRKVLVARAKIIFFPKYPRVLFQNFVQLRAFAEFVPRIIVEKYKPQCFQKFQAVCHKSGRAVLRCEGQHSFFNIPNAVRKPTLGD